MRDFTNEYRALLLKHARSYVRTHAEKLAAEDVAREIELVLVQLENVKGLKRETIVAPDAFVRAIVKHAAGRAKRRRKLIEQVAAGDDLDAVSDDLAALDSDLPEPNVELTEAAAGARAVLDGVKAKLEPKDALIFALLIEDDEPAEDVARILSLRDVEIDQALERILEIAAGCGVAEKAAPQRTSMIDAQERS